MAKNLLFFLLFCTLHFAFTPIFASCEPDESEILRADQCTAPPPDNFLITSLSTNFISLTWTPVWVGANHTLKVLINNGSGGWEPLNIIYNVPGSSYTVTNLQSGQEYRFIIATNCISGEPSELTAFINGITLVLDLAISGRNPLDPVPVNCQSIDYANHIWVGFRVLDERSNISNLFEFEVGDNEISSNNVFTYPKIKRVTLVHPIVAVNSDGDWPTQFQPSLLASSPFRMDRLLNGGPDKVTIGYVQLIQNTNPPSLYLCPDTNNIQQEWRKFYKFTALVAEHTDNEIASHWSEERSEERVIRNCKVIAESPFNASLNIFIPQSCLKDGKTTMKLFNLNGQMLMEHQFEICPNKVSFPINSISPGIYILRVETEDELQTIKVIKSE